MAIHFPTDAANDPGMNDSRGDKGAARNAPHHSRTSADTATSSRDEATPGKGINQAGFVRERDPGSGPGKDK